MSVLNLIPGLPLPVAQSTGGRARAQRVCVVETGPNPTSDYYLTERLAGIDRAGLLMRASLRGDPYRCFKPGEIEGTYLIFCRYVSSRWIRFCRRHQRELAGVALLIDDDIEALCADSGVPLLYRSKLWFRHLRHERQMRTVIDVALVSTSQVATRPAWARMQILPPIPALIDFGPARTATAAPVIAFHATGSHRAEHEWLRPIIADLARHRPNLRFDVVVPRGLSGLWDGIPNLTQTPALAWPEYRRLTRERGADILLAPLITSQINASRAPTKRIDAARMGAAFVTNAVGAYGRTDSERGICDIRDLAPETWQKALLALIDQPESIQVLATENRLLVASWRQALMAN